MASQDANDKLTKVLLECTDHTGLLKALKLRIDELQNAVNMPSLGPTAQTQLLRLLSVAETGRDGIMQHHVLKGLSFEQKMERWDGIQDAHADTLKWFLDQQEGTDLSKPQRHARSQFLQWLRCGTGFFHIAGKSGSGKSTLMKFLCGHPRTISELQQWGW